ncbi:glycosyltransferase family 2 protein [Pontibacter virosus]|uniref:GT2 family glycosyltransferase n=1 Tax=Pontibacter virosus TaxID=1765052 RepID=A0A2U1B2X3_9BACT|nr:glycosyltransferase family 2 protein [Pontibacter virosus]PVY43029.1 GT2 family glycosyltransferase [Pontibacter virosus]
MKAVYCIVITYNGKKWLNKCFKSLKDTDIPVKIIVIDNGSTDGTQDTIRKFYPEVDLIQSTENLGFGKANNVGIQKAIKEGAEYIFLLNQDAYLHRGSLNNLIAVFDKEPLAGIVSPIHLAGDERNLDRSFYNYISPENTPYLLGDLFTNNDRDLYETKFVNAAAWVIKSEVIKQVGMFHPIFDHYGEDNEYINRVVSNKFKVLISRSCIIAHDRPQNAKRLGKTKKHSERYKQRVLVKYFAKEYSEKQIDVHYLKLTLVNLALLNFKYSKLCIKCWLDIKKKIKTLNRSHQE